MGVVHWQASKAIEQLKGNVDTLIIVPNDRLLNVVGADTALQDAFLVADDVLRQGVQGISDIITTPGLVNVDFADVKAIMQNSGTAMLGVGASSSRNRAEEAALQATSAPLIEVIPAPSLSFNRESLRRVAISQRPDLQATNSTAQNTARSCPPPARALEALVALDEP